MDWVASDNQPFDWGADVPAHHKLVIRRPHERVDRREGPLSGDGGDHYGDSRYDGELRPSGELPGGVPPSRIAFDGMQIAPAAEPAQRGRREP